MAKTMFSCHEMAYHLDVLGWNAPLKGCCSRVVVLIQLVFRLGMVMIRLLFATLKLAGVSSVSTLTSTIFGAGSTSLSLSTCASSASDVPEQPVRMAEGFPTSCSRLHLGGQV